MALTKITGEGVGAVDNLTVDTNTLVVDATNNRVGVNTVSPNTSLEVVGAGSTTMRLHRDNASGGGGIDFYNNTQQVANINAGSGNLTLKADPTNAAGSSMISFETDGSEVGRWLAGGGLTFNGDTAAANALDDYEEGTWTPSSGCGSAPADSGKYTRVGRIVTVYGDCTFTGAGSANNQVTGLPFTVNTVQTAGCIGFNTIQNDLGIVCVTGQTRFDLYNQGSSGVNITTGKRIIFTAVYIS